MTENLEFEKNRIAVDDWIAKLSKEGVVGEMEPALLRGVLESYGANFEISEEAEESLVKFSNRDRRLGLDAVWGKEKIDAYRKWLKEDFVPGYEAKTGKELPVLENTKTKTSGGLKFFSDMIVFAAGLMDPGDYKRITERRAEKGRLWQNRDPKEPYAPTKYSSFPPEFPSEAWKYLKSRRPV